MTYSQKPERLPTKQEGILSSLNCISYFIISFEAYCFNLLSQFVCCGNTEEIFISWLSNHEDKSVFYIRVRLTFWPSLRNHRKRRERPPYLESKFNTRTRQVAMTDVIFINIHDVRFADDERLRRQRYGEFAVSRQPSSEFNAYRNSSFVTWKFTVYAIEKMRMAERIHCVTS